MQLCEGSSAAEHPAFRSEDDGSKPIPSIKFEVRPISQREAKPFIEQWHYSMTAAYERMAPKEREFALRELRNFGTVEHPIFSSDFKRREEYIAANDLYNREHPDVASVAPKGSAYAASLEARKKNPTITVGIVESE